MERAPQILITRLGFHILTFSCKGHLLFVYSLPNTELRDSNSNLRPSALLPANTNLPGKGSGDGFVWKSLIKAPSPAETLKEKAHWTALMTHCSTGDWNPLDLHLVLNFMEAKNDKVPPPLTFTAVKWEAKKLLMTSPGAALLFIIYCLNSNTCN